MAFDSAQADTKMHFETASILFYWSDASVQLYTLLNQKYALAILRHDAQVIAARSAAADKISNRIAVFSR
jgi:hypothetical protein